MPSIPLPASLLQYYRENPDRRKLMLLAIFLLFGILLRLVYGVVRRLLPSGKSIKKRRSSSRSKRPIGASKKRKVNSALPTLLVLVGVHGSGKSSWATQYVEKVRKSCIIVSSDVMRARLTGTTINYTREDEVEEAMLREVAHQILLKRNCIVDDCQHNLRPEFRAKLLAMAPEDSYNRVLRLFPIKGLFARTRIEKDIADGMIRYVPEPKELEFQLAQFEEASEVIKHEGWIQDK